MKTFSILLLLSAPLFNVDAEEALKLRLGIYLKDVASQGICCSVWKRDGSEVRNTWSRFECELRRKHYRKSDGEAILSLKSHARSPSTILRFLCMELVLKD